MFLLPIRNVLAAVYGYNLFILNLIIMISIKEAKFIILENTSELPVHPIPLAMALGSILGTEVYGGGPDIKKGAKLTPDAIGFLAKTGYTEVEVLRTPAVGIIVTGEEARQKDDDQKFGQNYESGSYFIKAGLKQEKINKINFYHADAHPKALIITLKEALDNNDVVIITCGLSTGCYDFVLNAANFSGVRQVFHRISKQPGRPLYFGKKDEKLVFGLSGTPSYVLDCFYQYVLPAIEKLNKCKEHHKNLSAVFK